MLLRLDWQSENRVMAVFDTYIAVIDPAPPPRSHATTTAGPRCKALRPDAARLRCF